VPVIQRFLLILALLVSVAGFVLKHQASQPALDLYLLDTKFDLPDAYQHLGPVRGKLVVPVHGGDFFMVFRRIQL